MCYLKLQNDHVHGERVEYSGPLLSQSHKIDELLEKHERHIRQVGRKSWFGKGTVVQKLDTYLH
jgi:hypothetical protein